MHARGFLVKQFPFDLALLYGDRDEAFPLEAFADFTRLGAWMLSPLNPIRVEWAAKTAVARAVRDIYKNMGSRDSNTKEIERYLEKIYHAHFSLREITFGLLNQPGVSYWQEFFDEGVARTETVVIIAATLLQLKFHNVNGINPSLNRAIQQASFPSQYSQGVSRQTAKDIWNYQAAAAPFLLAERWLTHSGADPEIEALLKEMVLTVPGNRDSYLLFEWLTSNGVLCRFLSTAKYLQLALTEILIAAKATRVNFAPFPENIPAVKIDIPQFTTVEVQRLREYSARD